MGRRVHAVVRPPPVNTVEYSSGKVANLNLLSDVDGEHVFCPLERARICFPCLTEHPLGVGGVRIDGQSRLDPSEQFTRLFGRGVLREDGFRHFRVGREPGPHRLRVQHFVDEDVNALREPDEVLGHAGVSRQHNGTAAVVDSVTERGCDGAMINQERGHLNTLSVINDALPDVIAHHLDAVAGGFFVNVAAHVNVKGERPLKVLHHFARALRPPDFKRDLAPAADPTSQEEVWNLDHVVGMQVRQE